jgi:ketosteroid isomerase-like protein
VIGLSRAGWWPGAAESGVLGEQTRLVTRRAGVDDSDFDGVVEAYRRALGAFVKGDARQVTDLFSRQDDVTLANPLGPPRRGWADVEKGIAEAAAHFVDGSIRFEEVSRYSTPDLGYVVQLERSELQFAGSQDMTPSSLRVTMIFRREGDDWRVAHRHADPITTTRPISTVIDT